MAHSPDFFFSPENSPVFFAKRFALALVEQQEDYNRGYVQLAHMCNLLPFSIRVCHYAFKLIFFVLNVSLFLSVPFFFFFFLFL